MSSIPLHERQKSKRGFSIWQPCLLISNCPRSPPDRLFASQGPAALSGDDQNRPRAALAPSHSARVMSGSAPKERRWASLVHTDGWPSATDFAA